MEHEDALVAAAPCQGLDRENFVGGVVDSFKAFAQLAHGGGPIGCGHCLVHTVGPNGNGDDEPVRRRVLRYAQAPEPGEFINGAAHPGHALFDDTLALGALRNGGQPTLEEGHLRLPRVSTNCRHLLDVNSLAR